MIAMASAGQAAPIKVESSIDPRAFIRCCERSDARPSIAAMRVHRDRRPSARDLTALVQADVETPEVKGAGMPDYRWLMRSHGDQAIGLSAPVDVEQARSGWKISIRTHGGKFQ